MPTVLLVRGWRVFFCADEGNEPIHVHAKKGDFDVIVEEWNRRFGDRDHAGN